MGLAPWKWDDYDDGDDWRSGDWCMHPAGYHGSRFEWDEEFSPYYVYHPYRLGHLGGEVYNGTGGTTTLRHGPYHVVSDLTILTDQSLVVEPGMTLEFESNRSVIAKGHIWCDGTAATISLNATGSPRQGMTLNGQMRLTDGGSLRLP